MNSKPFSRESLDDLLSLVATNAAHRPVGQTYLMTSDVAWQFPGCVPKQNIRLWSDQSGLSAYAWFQPPDALVFDVGDNIDDYAELLEEILNWADSRRIAFPPSYPFHFDFKSMDEWAEAIRNPPAQSGIKERLLSCSVLASDHQRRNLLFDHGFGETQHYEPIFVCNLANTKAAKPPANFTLRHVAGSEFEERVALHSAAWAPASGFNTAQYLQVRAMEQVFDADLDIVAVDNDGRFASYTIAWQDPVSRIGSFEPFGTHPDYRGTGVSKAVIAEGFCRLAARGMHTARVYTAGFNDQAARLYKSCGFEQIDTSRTLIRKA